MQSELKPCDFCGSGDAPFVIFEGQVWVECGDCTSRVVVGPFNTKAEAIAAWNTRASDAEIARLNIALKMQAAAVRTLHANEQTEINMLRAKAREAHIAIATLDSEREANAILTEALRAAEEREKALREALGFIEAKATNFIQSVDHYNEKHGEFIGGAPVFQLAKAVGVARQAIAGAKPC